MPLWLSVNSHSGVPLYVQLVDGVRKAIELGTLSSGDSLPTVRQLSSELRIAPNTISKAYMELQRMGLAETRAGAGTVVTAYSNPQNQDRSQQTFLELEEVLIRLFRLGVTPADILRFAEKILEPMSDIPEKRSF
jgi:GntR family transcriptional regulator